MKLFLKRGAQEEMFLKLMQLQTAPNPEDIVSWMFDHGVGSTLESYGFIKDELKKFLSEELFQFQNGHQDLIMNFLKI